MKKTSNGEWNKWARDELKSHMLVVLPIRGSLVH